MNQTQARRRAEANANADGRHAGVSDNIVVAEAHVTRSTDRIEQTAGSSEGVKKIKEKHSTTEFVNIERKEDERNADDDCTSGNVQNDGTLHPRENKKGRRHSVHSTEDVDGHLPPKTNAAAHAAKACDADSARLEFGAINHGHPR